MRLSPGLFIIRQHICIFPQEKDLQGHQVLVPKSCWPNTATLEQLPQDQSLELIPDIKFRKNYTPCRGDMVYFSTSDYLNFLHVADKMKTLNLDSNDMTFSVRASRFPDPFLVLIKKMCSIQANSLFFGTTRRVMSVQLQCLQESGTQFSVKYMDIGVLSKFMWPCRILRVSV